MEESLTHSLKVEVPKRALKRKEALLRVDLSMPSRNYGLTALCYGPEGALGGFLYLYCAVRVRAAVAALDEGIFFRNISTHTVVFFFKHSS